MGDKPTPEQANEMGIANRIKKTYKDGEEVITKTPAIRQQSGIYAEKEFEDYPFKDAGGKTDNMTSWAATADNITEGEGFGPMYTRIAAPAYKTVADRNDFISIYAAQITNLAKKAGLVKGAWGVLDSKDGEIIFHLLEGKEVESATDKHRAFVKGMRGIYDEMRVLANDVRVKLGKKPIGYLENYASHIRRTSLFQQLIEQFQTTISENFDFVIPNEKKNPFAMKRLGGMEDKETNFWKIIDGYIQAIASDIYISPLVEKIKSVASVLEGREMYKSKKFLDSFIRNNLLKKPDTIDNYTGMRAGSKIRKGIGRIIHARQLGALAGNIEWVFFTQPMSMGNTVMKTGIPNTLKGLLKWFDPKLRAEINRYTAMRLKRRAGAVTSALGDIDKRGEKVFKGRVDKFNAFLGLLGDTMEHHLTGCSIAAGLEKGKQYGLEGEQLWLYADYIGQVTQSMYNPETRMQLLNSMATRAAFPFQSFAGEMFRHLRTLTGKGGGLPLNKRQRLGHILNLIIATFVVNEINERARGRKLVTVGTFIPLVGGFVDEQLARAYNAVLKRVGKKGARFRPGRVPIAPMEDIKRLTDAARDLIQHGNPTRFRRELVFWGAGLSGIGGAGQMNKFIDGMVALEKGYVEDVAGRKLFKVESWSALWRGPWGTPEGKAYKRGTRDKKTEKDMLSDKSRKDMLS